MLCAMLRPTLNIAVRVEFIARHVPSQAGNVTHDLAFLLPFCSLSTQTESRESHSHLSIATLIMTVMPCGTVVLIEFDFSKYKEALSSPGEVNAYPYGRNCVNSTSYNLLLSTRTVVYTVYTTTLYDYKRNRVTKYGIRTTSL